MLITYLLYLLMIKIFADSPYIQNLALGSIRETTELLQAYVDENHIRFSDHEKLRNWQKTEDCTILFYGTEKELAEELETEKERSVSGSREIWRMEHALPLKLEDETIYVYLLNKQRSALIILNNLLTLFIGLLIYTILMNVFVGRIINYLIYLRDELEMMSSGDLDRTILIKGEDEISEIAEQIDDLRNSFKGQIKKEHEAVMANHDLITSMSHDLRTPLTRLIGYLEILKQRKYEGSEQLENYVDKARDNAFVIRNVMDQLFHYFIALKHDEAEVRLEEIEGVSYLNGLLTRQIDYLESRDFDVSYDPVTRPFFIRVFKPEFPRIFENLFQNIDRYADRDHPVVIGHHFDNDMLILEFENVIREDRPAIESNHLGLKIITRIVNMMNGSMEVKFDGNKHVTRLYFPVNLPGGGTAGLPMKKPKKEVKVSNKQL